MIRLAFAVAVALLALCVVSPASAGVTRLPNGLFIGDFTSDTPSTTPGDDDLYVKGTFEADGAADLDSTLNVEGAVTLQSTIAVTGAATFNGAVTLGNAAGDAITLTGTLTSATDISLNNKDLVLGDGDEYGFSVDSSANTWRVLGSSDQDNLRDTSVMTATTSEVCVFEALGVGKADGNDDKTITLYAGDKTDATVVYDYSDDDIDVNKTISTACVVITAAASPPFTATTPAGAMWMTSGSPNQESGVVGDGAGGTEVPQANILYVFDGTEWQPSIPAGGS